jgi:hypothetical protein
MIDPSEGRMEALKCRLPFSSCTLTAMFSDPAFMIPWRLTMKPAYPNASFKTTYQVTPSTTSKKKRRRTMAGAGLLLLLLVAWYLWPGSQLAKARQMQEELFSASRDQLSPEERKQKLEALRAEREKLSPEERKQLRQDMGKQIQRKVNAEAAKYLAMSPAERQKVIDDRLAREQMSQQKPPRAAASGLTPPSGSGGPTTPATPEERDSKRRESLLRLTPEARAGMDQIRLDMATRRAQLHLPASIGRGFGGR